MKVCSYNEMRRRIKGRRVTRFTKKIQLRLDLLNETAKQYGRDPAEFDLLIKITGEIEVMDRRTAGYKRLRFPSRIPSQLPDTFGVFSHRVLVQ